MRIENRRKAGSLRLLSALAAVFPLFLPISAQCQTKLKDAEPVKPKVEGSRTERHRRKVEAKELENCSWLVTYKDRIYDLSPLTRKSLDRPLEGDISSVVRRSPRAEFHLNNVEKNISAAKVHTAIATTALLGLIGARIAQANSKNGNKPKYLMLNIGAVLLFARAAYAGFELKQESKQEVAKAIQEFNSASEDPILPYDKGE